jgi:uncharacterized protein YjiK
MAFYLNNLYFIFILMKYNYFFRIYLIAAFFLLSLTRGQSQSKSNASPTGYNLQAPKIIRLPKDVNQISGIAYYEADNTVFAIDDDHGNLYKISLKQKPQIKHWEFGKAKDYEEVVLVNNTFYVLNSTGNIVYFPFSFPIQKVEKAGLGLGGKNEFEILYKDPSADRLMMICKQCEADKKNEVSVYAFSLATNSFEKEPVAVLNVKEIEARLDKKIGKFKASSANVHPLTGDVYIVSAINHLLVVAGPDMSVKGVFELNDKLFKQPEGLCFNSKGDLFISNEAAGKGEATILMYRYQQ